MYCLSPVEEMYNTFCLYFHKNAEHLLLPVDHMSQNVISSFADVEQKGKAVWAPKIKPYKQFHIQAFYPFFFFFDCLFLISSDYGRMPLILTKAASIWSQIQ